MSKRNELVLNSALVVVTLLALGLGGMRVSEWWLGPHQERPRRVSDWKRYGEDGQTIGPSSALVTIVEFADYECPFCRKAAPEIQRILREYPRNVRLVYRHYPLGFHAHALEAARAAICAAHQGAFQAYHDLLFDPSTSLEDEPWLDLASQAGIADSAEFRTCVTQDGTIREVASDTIAGNELGLVGTPLFLINDLRVSGYAEAGLIERFVEQQLRRAGGN